MSAVDYRIVVATLDIQLHDFANLVVAIEEEAWCTSAAIQIPRDYANEAAAQSPHSCFGEEIHSNIRTISSGVCSYEICK